jgi:hypothetical protein
LLAGPFCFNYFLFACCCCHDALFFYFFYYYKKIHADGDERAGCRPPPARAAAGRRCAGRPGARVFQGQGLLGEHALSPLDQPDFNLQSGVGHALLDPPLLPHFIHPSIHPFIHSFLSSDTRVLAPCARTALVSATTSASTKFLPASPASWMGPTRPRSLPSDSPPASVTWTLCFPQCPSFEREKEEREREKRKKRGDGKKSGEVARGTAWDDSKK